MYEPVNNRLIVMMPGEETTASGIILNNSQSEAAVLRMEVFAVSEGNSRFAGRTVLVERRLVRELPQKGYGAVDAKEVLAVETT